MSCVFFTYAIHIHSFSLLSSIWSFAQSSSEMQQTSEFKKGEPGSCCGVVVNLSLPCLCQWQGPFKPEIHPCFTTRFTDLILKVFPVLFYKYCFVCLLILMFPVPSYYSCFLSFAVFTVMAATDGGTRGSERKESSLQSEKAACWVRLRKKQSIREYANVDSCETHGDLKL